MPQMKTIRQVASMGVLTEHSLRRRQKAGKLPGLYSGNRFLVDVEALQEMLRTESMEAVKMEIRQ